MIRTQVRCDKRVSFRDRREGWTCVCPSPGVARTHVATRTESLEPGTLGKHGPGPRHRPYEVVGAKKHQHRLQPRRKVRDRQGTAPGRTPTRSRILPRRASTSSCFDFSTNALTTSSRFRTRSGDQVWNLLSRADWLLSQPRTLRCQPTALGQRLTNGLWGPL